MTKHYLWQYQQWNVQHLHTAAGEPLTIVDPGRIHSNQGPDFVEAKIRIDNVLFIGTVEIHVCTSDWYKHRHEVDPNYTNVILHVVWQHDQPQSPGNRPLLELQGRVPKFILSRYEYWLTHQEYIPCGKQAQLAPTLIWTSWKDRLLAERLEEKCIALLRQRLEYRKTWNEIYWQILARTMGGPVNGFAFEQMAVHLPSHLLQQNNAESERLEALILGCLGLLNFPFRETYPRHLQQRYQQLKMEYSVREISQPVYFLRMRPGNFPSLRAAQVAAWWTSRQLDVTATLPNSTWAELRDSFQISASSYWDHHYRLDHPSAYCHKRTGLQWADSIVINACVPVLFALGRENGEPSWEEQALSWLSAMQAEKNSIIRKLSLLNIPVASAADSQALLQLKNKYCNKKLCLDCAIGVWLLKS